MAEDLKTLGRKNLSMRRIHEIYHDAGRPSYPLLPVVPTG